MTPDPSPPRPIKVGIETPSALRVSWGGQAKYRTMAGSKHDLGHNQQKYCRT